MLAAEQMAVAPANAPPPSAAPLSGRDGRRAAILGVVATAGLTVLAFLHRHLAALPPTAASPLAPLDAVFSLVLLAALLLLAGAIGGRLLRPLAIGWQSSLEAALFSGGVGFAVIADATLALSLLHVLYAPVLLAAGGLTIVLLRDEFARFWTGWQRCARLVPGRPRREPAAVVVLCFGVLFLLLALAVALLPPFTYDALWYHLAVPQTFVQQHRFVVMPELDQAQFPLTIEMLYAVCLAFAGDRTPALLHLSFAVGSALAVYVCGRRWGNRRVAWLAVAAFITASEVQRWALVANIDLALTFYEFLALYAVLAWREDRRATWLVLAGVMVGVAMASKYTAVMELLPLGLLVLAGAGWRPGNALLRAFGGCLLFGLVAVTVASPWYVKNAVVFHDPVYPLLAPPYVEPTLSVGRLAAPAAASRQPLPLRILAAPLHLLTTEPELALSGRGWRDYLLLPLTVYQRGDLESRTQPSLLFLLAPFCVFLLRRPVVRRLALTAGILSVVWAMGPQQLRYALPVFPVLAVLAAFVLDAIAVRLRPRLARLAVLLPAALLLTLTLATDLAVVGAIGPLPVLLGAESRAAFLGGASTDYGALAYLQQTVQPGERVLAIGERRSYYARAPIIFDDHLTLAWSVFIEPGSLARSALLLRQAHVDYVLYEPADLEWTAQFETSIPREQAAFDRFRVSYLVEVYQDSEAQVYRVKESAGT